MKNGDLVLCQDGWERFVCKVLSAGLFAVRIQVLLSSRVEGSFFTPGAIGTLMKDGWSMWVMAEL